ncbi:MAG: YdbL family protein [gamma proteobacterium symbiont of Bathyaustriella thionipta]|nr:YdbL family protein [gamma proteobacterium symbiont of Bathyaustriella thionipta]
MKSIKVGLFVFALVVLSACVTINVYFPAAQAEAVADRIASDVLKGVEPAEPLEQQPQSFVPAQGNSLFAVVLDWVIPSAQAAQPSFTANTPEVRRLQAAMAQRVSRLKPFYQSGAIGFSNNALLGMRDKKAVSLKQRSQLKQLLNAENADRNALYREIARANGHPEWEAEIRATFSKSWVDAAPRGWWYQKSNGSWVKK